MILLLIALMLLHRYGRSPIRAAIFAVFCIWSSYESICALMQVAGLSVSRHSAFAMTGNFINPGPLGGYLAVSLAVELSYLIKYYRKENNWLQKILYYIALISAALGFLVLPATMCRGAWLALIVAIGIFLLTETRLKEIVRKRKYLVPTVIVLGLVLSVGAFFLKKESAVGRLHIWHMELRSIAEHPFGSGAGTALGAYGRAQESYFREHLNDVPDLIVQVAGCPEYPFNEYLGLGMEFGWAGLIVALLVVSFATAVLFSRGSVYAAGMLAWAVFAFSSYPLSVPQTSVQLIILLSAVVPETKTTGRWTSVPVVFALSLLVITLSGKENKDFSIVDRSDYKDLYARGHQLYQQKEYIKSNEVLNKGAEISSDPLFHIIIGRNYEAMGQYEAALDEYTYAYYMVPCRIYPLVRIMRLEIALGNNEAAVNIGRTILNNPLRAEHAQMKRLYEETHKSVDSLNTSMKSQKNNGLIL